MDIIFLVWNLPSFKCLQQIQNFIRDLGPNKSCLQAGLGHGPPVYNLWSWTLVFCCKVSILCSLSDTLQANYLMTAFCSYIFLSLHTWDLQLTKQTLPKVIPLVWILFLGFTRLFTRELHGSYQCRYSMPWMWGWGRWAVWVFCLKVYYWRKMSPEKRNFHFLFLPSLVFPSLCPIVTLVWSLF